MAPTHAHLSTRRVARLPTLRRLALWVAYRPTYEPKSAYGLAAGAVRPLYSFGRYSSKGEGPRTTTPYFLYILKGAMKQVYDMFDLFRWAKGILSPLTATMISMSWSISVCRMTVPCQWLTTAPPTRRQRISRNAAHSRSRPKSCEVFRTEDGGSLRYGLDDHPAVKGKPAQWRACACSGEHLSLRWRSHSHSPATLSPNAQPLNENTLPPVEYQSMLFPFLRRQ